MCAGSSGGDTESVAWESEGLLERDDVARPVLPGELLCFRDLRLRHVFGDMFLAFVSARLALRGSDVEPGVRGYVVLGPALAVGVHEPEAELREGVTLLGGEAVPPLRSLRSLR